MTVSIAEAEKVNEGVIPEKTNCNNGRTTRDYFACPIQLKTKTQIVLPVDKKSVISNPVDKKFNVRVIRTVTKTVCLI